MERGPNKQKRKHVPASFEALFSDKQRAEIQACIERGRIETDREAALMGKAANYLEAAAVVMSRYILTEARKIRRANLAAEREPKGNAKLNDHQIAAILQRLDEGTPQAAIAREFRVSQMAISFVNQGKRVARDSASATLTRVDSTPEDLAPCPSITPDTVS